MSVQKPKCMTTISKSLRAAEKAKKPLDTSEEISVRGKTIVITGANSGIGVHAALGFAKRGARLVMPCRDMKKAQVVVDDIKTKVPDADLTLVQLDFGDLDSVRTCAAEIRKIVDHIDILCNNAGLMNSNSSIIKTKQGFESHMGINYLGPFLFTNLLLDLVIKAGAGSRIVFTASGLYQLAELDLDDIMLEKCGSFGSANAGPYANSKLANMYNVHSLAKRLQGTGVHTYAQIQALPRRVLDETSLGLRSC